MAGVGIVLCWFGYSVFYYGLDTVKGGNDSFVSLIWPGRYQATAPDSPGTAGWKPAAGPNKPIIPGAPQLPGHKAVIGTVNCTGIPGLINRALGKCK